MLSEIYKHQVVQQLSSGPGAFFTGICNQNEDQKQNKHQEQFMFTEIFFFNIDLIQIKTRIKVFIN